jgi:hypothetical protein
LLRVSPMFTHVRTPICSNGTVCVRLLCSQTCR